MSTHKIDQIFLKKEVEIVQILILRVKLLSGGPFRNSKGENYNPHEKKKHRGKKYGYMIFTRLITDNPEIKNKGYGFRVYTKKSAIKILNQIDAYIKSTIRTLNYGAGGHFKQNLIEIVYEKLYKNNVLGEKHFRTLHNSIGNKDFFPSWYEILKELP